MSLLWTVLQAVADADAVGDAPTVGSEQASLEATRHVRGERKSDAMRPRKYNPPDDVRLEQSGRDGGSGLRRLKEMGRKPVQTDGLEGGPDVSKRFGNGRGQDIAETS